MNDAAVTKEQRIKMLTELLQEVEETRLAGDKGISVEQFDNELKRIIEKRVILNI